MLCLPESLGFHLSASIVKPIADPYDSDSDDGYDYYRGKINNVSITFDRRRIMSCKCTCDADAGWCAHVIAVCIYRIRQVPH